MSELITFAERWGWGVAIAVYVVYKSLPALLDKIIPNWMAGIRERRNKARQSEADDRKALLAVYERFIDQQKETLKYLGSATAVNQSVQRSLDQNTQEIMRLRVAVERGPRCPLPDCPFMGRDNIAPVGESAENRKRE